MAAEYHFITRWSVEADIQEVSDLLGDAEALARWWPSVYLRVAVLEPGGKGGVGKLVDLHTKGFLPYTLRWRFRVTENREPHGFSIAAEGDFVGTGVWTFKQNGKMAEITYDWRIAATKPLLRRLSFMLRPLFSWNHEWAMRRGLESMKLELPRMRAATKANPVAQA